MRGTLRCENFFLQIKWELALDGATALYPLYSAFVRATYPEDHDLDKSQDENLEGGAIIPESIDEIVSCTNTMNAYECVK